MSSYQEREAGALKCALVQAAEFIEKSEKIDADILRAALADGGIEPMVGGITEADLRAWETDLGIARSENPPLRRAQCMACKEMVPKNTVTSNLKTGRS